MMDNLSPDTTLALLKAGQSDASKSGQSLEKAAKDKNMEKVEHAAQDFEALFIAEMMKPMFENIKPDPMFGGGKGEEIFQGMMLQEYGKLMAQTGQIGISDSIKEAILQLQEAQNGSAETLSTNDEEGEQE